ncbi:L,D-transpeptidase family protein [Pedobacter gandavensis]|uniref:L,D-transpeptidase family protein n=1 Tax=Pedobacter gandavensis TaxID=2679963 RepID=A0ABR6ESN6_9SPHI|nr:L,D-transpeptidase family protein [Pedobacter gandavensis]MBB2148281.1 L,D-transpeptidase family protein [Pedobacter gandavensis]
MNQSTKYFGLLLLWLGVITFCLWPKPHKVEVIEPVIEVTGVKWHDSLFKHLPLGIDTTIIVKDSKDNSLSFRQYLIPVFNHEAMIFQDRGIWRLQRLTKAAYDSVAKDDDAVARYERASAYGTKDTERSWKFKLQEIAHTLSAADHIVVFKGKRKMIVSRKNKPILTFNIDLGFNPNGNKITEGDGKTPEGIYHVDIKHYRRDKFYKSFWISYPNEKDKAIAQKNGVKPGSNIMIHGTYPEKTNAKDWTAGCIALQNYDIDQLFKVVNAGTVIEVRK